MDIRALIVDDEPLAREGLRDFLSAEPDVVVVAECRDGVEAVAAVRQHHPDLVLLDVQMPEISGLDVLRELAPAEIPAVIFITAYDKYALDAFQVHALDYLLKPVDAERFRTALGRARVQIQYRRSGHINERILQLLGHLSAKGQFVDRLMIKQQGRVFFIKVEEIDWIQAAGNYVKLHVGERWHLMRETMAKLSAKLDPKQFVRIHRSTIVNLERVKEIQPWFQGEHVVLLHDGHQLTLSRTYREKLHDVLGG